MILLLHSEGVSSSPKDVITAGVLTAITQREVIQAQPPTSTCIPFLISTQCAALSRVLAGTNPHQKTAFRGLASRGVHRGASSSSSAPFLAFFSREVNLDHIFTHLVSTGEIFDLDFLTIDPQRPPLKLPR